MDNTEHIEDNLDDVLDDNENVGGKKEREVRLEFNVDPGQESVRIDKFVLSKLEGATRNKIQQALDAGDILVNDKTVKSNYKIRPNDKITVFETREVVNTEVIPEEMDLNIVHEDDSLLIINKPAGMVVHPANGNYTGTLVNGLAHYLAGNHIDTEDLTRVGLVHRIDKNTSGIIVIGKTEDVVAKLSAQFKAHTVHRRYIALVWGDLAEDEGTIEAHIGRHQKHRKKMCAYPEGEHGKHAITHYKVLQRFNYVTMVELRLETGRTHQIRVHMQHIGHPLFNDSTYGGDKIVKGTVFSKYKQFIDNCFKTLPRHALHAKELGFVHPANNEEVMYNSELPNDMQEVLNKWTVYTKGMHTDKMKKPK